MNESRLIINSPFRCRGRMSYGLIIHSCGKLLLIRRKHSAEMTIVLRGNYRSSQLIIFLQGMTAEERGILRDIIDGNTTYDEVYANVFGKRRGANPEFFVRNSPLIRNIISVLDERNHSPHLEWGFPKGQKEKDESEISCALRETQEETGICIDINDVNAIHNNPFIETINTSNGRMYENKYWLVNLNQIPQVEETNCSNEVSECQWVDVSEIGKYLGTSRCALAVGALQSLPPIYEPQPLTDQS